MNNKVITGIFVVVLVILLVWAFTGVEEVEYTKEESVEIAEVWIIENSPTYTERGGEDLTLQHEEVLTDNTYEFTFAFEAMFAGYGPVEEDEMAAQVITEHEMVVVVENGEVVEAITGEVYDELNQQLIEEDLEEDMVEARVYFYVVEDGMEEVSPVTREFPVPEDIKSYTLTELMEGPTQEESEEGYSTAIPEGASLESVYTEEGVAYADFSQELDASGSATVMMIRDQIEKTLLQFDDVDEVVISIEEETEEILQP